MRSIFKFLPACCLGTLLLAACGAEPEAIQEEASCNLEATHHWFAQGVENFAAGTGAGFGEDGDEYVRFSLIENEHRTRQAIRGIKNFLSMEI